MKIYKFRMFRLMVINVLKYMRKLKHYKKSFRFRKLPCWDTRIRTWNDRTGICSVTITPYPNFHLRVQS